jgi:prophage regulatory protein
MSIGKEMNKKNITKDHLLSLKEVMEMTGQARSSIYYWMSIGHFPKPKKVGLRSVAWIREDVQKWLNDIVNK